MRAVIEMSKGTNEKTEVDKKTGKLFVDRKLDVTVPANYGFITNTLASDGDPLDVFVLGPTLDGLTELDVVPIGIFLCKDQDVEDHKILAVPMFYKESDLDKATHGVAEYLRTYKKGFKVICYVTNPLSVLAIYKKSKIRTVYKHPKLSLKVLLGILAFTGLLIYLDRFLR
jgi:inorganic pyrophosphatase